MKVYKFTSSYYLLSNNIYSNAVNGGVLRSKQIKEILEKKHESGCKPYSGKIKLYQLIFYFFLMRDIVFPRLNAGLIAYLRLLRDNVNAAILFSSIERRKDSPMINIELNIGVSMYLALALVREKYFELIVYPHNIESLVSFQVWPECDPSLCHFMEKCIFEKAKEVVTISSYDRNVVKLYSNSVSVLHYYPFKERLEWLKSLIKARDNVVRSSDLFLLSGNISNPPFERFLLMLMGRTILPFDINVKVFGVSREDYNRLMKILAENNRKLNGKISFDFDMSHQRYQFYLTTCRGILVYQAPTSGFVTRIPEASLLRMEILVNDSYYELHKEDMTAYSNVFSFSE